MLNLYDADGMTVKLGERIGSGGEGAVYAIQGKSGHWAAKIFHERPSTEKREKLGDMVKGWNENLKRIAAWPLSTLHEWNSGPVCGFIMPRVLDCRPIHQLYSPFQRKQLYPERDWAFLVSTARNVAAAFETVHAHGHVIGDVNPNLVLVAADSQVNLIDCDSFQIAANGKHYLCEVAVPHFTPPELQGHCGFSGVLRTVNHDNFGLALLLFHLLLMGRHPYAGLYPDLPDLPLEAAIQQFRYAYSHDHGLRKVQAPPAGLTPGVLPGQLAWMFIQAFTESGIQSPGRPAAQEWVQALDGLLKAIKPCTEDQAHRYFNGLPACPWCAHTEKFGNVFFIPRPPVSSVKAAPAYSTPAMHNVLDESSRAKSAAALNARITKFPWQAVAFLLFFVFGAIISPALNHSLDSTAKPNQPAGNYTTQAVELPPPTLLPPADTGFMGPVKPDSPSGYMSYPKPDYPKIAIARGWQGKVMLRVKINFHGGVEHIKLEQSSGHDILDKAAMDAVAKWRFTPARRGIEPVTSSVMVPIVFSLKGG